MSTLKRSQFYFLLVTLALCVTTVLFVFGYYQQISEVRRQTKAFLESWQNDLGRALADGDYYSISRIGKSLDVSGLAAGAIFQSQRVLFVTPSEDALAQCQKMQHDLPIHHYGVLVGRLVTCTTSARIINLVLKSKLFVYSLTLVFILAGVCGILPLFRYRRSLHQVMEYLEHKVQMQSSTSDLNRFGHDPIAKRMERLVQEAIQRQVSLQREVDELEKSQQLSELARQVAHDISSPLSALNVVAKAMQNDRDQRFTELVVNAVDRIFSITKELLEGPTGPDSRIRGKSFFTPTNVVSAIQELILEKKHEYHGRGSVKIDFRHQNFPRATCVCLAAHELQRILSNIINNSFEACEGKGYIEISLFALDSKVKIVVSDSGKGIPAEILAQVGKRGLTYGKSQRGHGLGLARAIETVEAAYGELKIASQVGQGTQVSMMLPKYLETQMYLVSTPG